MFARTAERVLGLVGRGPDETAEEPDALEELAEEDANLGVYPRDGTWGNNIQWRDWEERRVRGWKEVPKEIDARPGVVWRPVQDGDRFAYELESGLVAVFELVDVERMRDPPDMFYADARAVGYLEGTDESVGYMEAADV